MSMSMSVDFNASIQVTELLMKTLENVAKDLASRCILESSKRHGFDASEEIRFLGLENLSLIRKQMSKKSSGSKCEKKIPKKSLFPVPFIPASVDINGCQGLSYNRGLFTQCSKKRMESGLFCSVCQLESDKNASGCPDCGTVDSRLATGLYEFKDPKNRRATSYLKVLEKVHLSVDQALEEACKLSLEIPEEHFAVLNVSKDVKKSKGRPKKVGTVEAENVSDLFAKLSAEGEDDIVLDDEPVKKKSKLTDEEKSKKKASLEAERAAKKLEKETQAAIDKAEKEAKRKEEVAVKKAEREAKLAIEKSEREAKIAAEKAEREAKRLKEKEEKEAKKPAKSKKSTATEATATATEATATEAKPAKVSVTRILIEGKNYLKSSTNILYDPETKEEVGIWDPETKTINELPDDEEEEEEYEDL